jgi:hypothetical protein
MISVSKNIDEDRLPSPIEMRIKGPSATSDLPKYYTESLLIEGEPTREEDETDDQSEVLIVSSDYIIYRQ